MALQSLVLGCMTVTVVLAGLAVVFFVMFLPVIEAFLLASPQTIMQWVVLAAVQGIHLYLLWTSVTYLSVFRRLAYPVRKLIMPLVFVVSRIESIREETPTLYFDLSTIRSEADLMKSFRHSVRRRYKSMERTFQKGRIRHKAVRSEEALNLSLVVPVMWEHERRCCQADGKNVVEEFIKRFLVVTMTTNAVLDMYYAEDGRLGSVQLSVKQGECLHWFMYFCSSQSSRSGIWYHGIRNAMVRALRTPVRYINAQVHQEESKRSAGLASCPYTDSDRLKKLYALAFTEDLPSASVNTSVWSFVTLQTGALSSEEQVRLLSSS